MLKVQTPQKLIFTGNIPLHTTTDDFEEGEWGQIVFDGTTGLQVLKKITTTPTSLERCVPVFSATANRADVSATLKATVVESDHFAYTDQWKAAETFLAGSLLAVENGELLVATTGETVVAMCREAPVTANGNLLLYDTRVYTLAL
jgi:hypothetical protein